MSSRKARLLVSVLAPLAVLGCDGDGYDPDAQFAPSLRPAFGARADAGALRFSTGTPCHGVTEIRVTFDPGDDHRATTVLTAPAPGRTLETFDPTGPVEGFSVTEPLPSGFEWRDADAATFQLEADDFYWGSTVDLAPVAAESAERPADAYYFDGVGWLDAAEVAEQNGTSFLTPCTPDPQR